MFGSNSEVKAARQQAKDQARIDKQQAKMQAQKAKEQSKIAEKEAKERAAAAKFGVDLDSYTDDVLRKKNNESARAIAADLSGSKLYSFGSLLSGDSNETFALEMARAQVEQNFILIRQNEEIIRLLKKIAEK